VRRLERRPERVEKRWPHKVEDSHVLRVLERLNEQRLQREPHQTLP